MPQDNRDYTEILRDLGVHFDDNVPYEDQGITMEQGRQAYEVLKAQDAVEATGKSNTVQSA